jgi:hypothetical protein
VLRQFLKNRGHLHWGLSFAKDDLWHPDAYMAVMVHLRESQVFEWKVAQTLDRVIGRKLPGTYFCEQLANLCSVQRLIGQNMPKNASFLIKFDVGQEVSRPV